MSTQQALSSPRKLNSSGDFLVRCPTLGVVRVGHGSIKPNLIDCRRCFDRSNFSLTSQTRARGPLGSTGTDHLHGYLRLPSTCGSGGGPLYGYRAADALQISFSFHFLCHFAALSLGWCSGPWSWLRCCPCRSPSLQRWALGGAGITDPHRRPLSGVWRVPTPWHVVLWGRLHRGWAC